MKCNILSFVAVLVSVSLQTQASGTIHLDSAQRFAVLGGSTVTNTGPTIVTGDLGVSPGSAITGFPPGIVIGVMRANDAVAQQAHDDVTTAYNLLAGMPITQNLTGQNLGGLTLTPGVYFFSSSALLTSSLTLDAQGNPNALFVFQIGSTLTTANSSAVVTVNGAQGRNVYWQVGSAATLGTDTAFQGNILALASITLNTSATILNGRALAINGAVTLDSNTITAGVAMHSDFDGDGRADLAIGVPREDVGSKVNAGAVNVIYGSSGGLSATGAKFWSQDSTGIVGSASAGDGFGTALANGDFNGDGYADLAIGIPFKNTSSKADSGAVIVLYGSAGGLISTGNQLWTQDTTGIKGSAGAGDHFGAALIAGDFNGDGFEDLAIGVPGETVIGHVAAGAVAVIYGSASGLIATGNQLWSQNSTGIASAAEAGDAFGLALAAGNFNGDLYMDLAIGVPLEDIGTNVDAGMVHMIPGSAAGLAAANSKIFIQGSGGIRDTADAGDNFGASLAGGDFDGDTFDDLAIGAPLENIGTKVNAGAVNVIYGSAGGLTSTGNQFWTQNSSGIANSAEAHDAFGSSLVAGDVDNDGYADLGIGVPSEGFINAAKAGAVHCIYGSAVGLASAGSQLWHAIMLGLGLTPGALAGSSLALGDFNGDGCMDTANGSPGAIINGKAGAGSVGVLYGSITGLTATGFQIWDQNVTGIPDSAETGDNFGASLAR